MKPALLFALLLWQSAAGPPPPGLNATRNFRYERTITLPFAVPVGSGPSCAILDPAIFPHAGLSLRDLRLFQGSREVPYAITLSEPAQPDADTAVIRNLGLHHDAVVFDLEMPHRPYTEIVLDLAGRDFVATASVSGTRNSDYSSQIHLGDFTLFDLSTQHLSRSTVLALQETDLPFLHVELTVSPTSRVALTPQTLLKMVQGVSVPPSREAQSVYSTVAISREITKSGRRSFATFLLRERVPVERVSFDLAAGYKGNFSREIHITDQPDSAQTGAFSPPNGTFHRQIAAILPSSSDKAGEPSSETLAGTIFRVHLTQAGREISRQQLSVPATLGSNMQSAATVQISVDNGDDAPLPLTSIRLEMRQRKLCFDAASAPRSPSRWQTATPLTLFYGDPSLAAPEYDFERVWNLAVALQSAGLGPEQLNPAYRAPADTRPFPERHPNVLWIVLIAVLGVLFTIALRSSRSLQTPQ